MSKTPAQLVVDCVHGEPPPTYTGDEIGAARRILDQKGITPQRISSVMAWVTSHRRWPGIVVNVCKLELHLAAILVEMAGDRGGNAIPQAEAPYVDPTPPELQGQLHASLDTEEAKRRAVRQEWWDLIEEAHRLGLKGPEMSRWVFKKRAELKGYEPIDPLGFLKGIGVGVKPSVQPPSGRPRVEPHRLADQRAPKAAMEPEIDNPRHFAEREEERE